MIADTAIFAASPWQNDQFLGHEVMKAIDDVGHVIDTDVAALEAQINQMKDLKTDFGKELQLMQSSLMGNSCGTSVASSECSDELGLDADTDSLFGPSGSNDLFNSTLLNILTESTNADQLEFSPFDLAEMYPSSYDADSAGAHWDIIESPVSHSSPPTPVKRKHRETGIENKPWSSLQHSEQLQVIEDLTKIISEEMGLREQLEVIRIINPRASVSPTDTEFVIDLECLSDEKLHRVREYVRQNCQRNSQSDSSCSSRSERGSPVQKKTSKKQRQIESRENRLRQRKEQRQIEKEKRSGLFRQEEVLALSEQDPGNESDIDILT